MRKNENEQTWQRLWNRRQTLLAKKIMFEDALVIHQKKSGNWSTIDPKESLDELRPRLAKVNRKIRARAQMNKDAQRFFLAKKLKYD